MIVNNPQVATTVPSAGGAWSVELARTHIEKLILDGALGPGARLNELSLSSRLGVSRPHLRQAVRLLEEARLVTVFANRGAFVRSLGLEDALELFEVRAGFARTAGRLAALRATPDDLSALNETHLEMQTAAQARDIPRFHSLNMAFHERLFAAAANPRLTELDRGVRNEMQLYIRRNVSGDGQLQKSWAEHGKILAALLAADEDVAGAAFERHILNGKGRLMARA